MSRNKTWRILGFLVLVLGMSCFKMEAYAAQVKAYFGTEEGYLWNLGEKSPIGFYLESEDAKLKEVEMVVTYDPAVLRFASNEDEDVTVLEEGKLSLKQNAAIEDVYKKIVQFVPLTATETWIEITEAKGQTDAGETVLQEAVVTKVTIPMEAGCELRSIEVDGKKLEAFEPTVLQYRIDVDPKMEKLPVNVTVYDGTEAEVSDTTLKTGENTIYITTTNEAGEKARYTLTVVREEENLSEETKTQEEETLTAEEETALEMSRDESENGQLQDTAFTEQMGEEKSEGNLTWKNKLLLAAIILVALLLIFEIVFFFIQVRKKKKQKAKKQRTKKQEELSDKELLFDTGEIKLEEEEWNPVVISANKVCMDFSRAVNEYTSIKDLVIQTVKGKRIKEVYRALNEVSFEIRKGEVIGVIGTNGAGKSTLLKIIAGAMNPTSGSIRVNQGRIQILTLGTGFDMELTGRENVYLNGAIIGYEKEFIDQHYEEIVEFAELQDFMNEKVKNYSSGMVSRLGFAIATVGEAAEILILDEVLSVGDRIFQKKSMKRIKEMIHGGSTVIMVSHSTKTISENCDRAIWLEKGHMIATGDARRLCAAYEKYDGNFERVLRVMERVKKE